MFNAEMLTTISSDPSFLFNLVAFLLGLTLHVGQKMFQHDVPFREYVNTHGGRTLLSLTTLVSSFIAISVMFPGAAYITYFFGGYSIDSLMNKVPMSIRGAMNHLPVEKKLELYNESQK